jgi:hypothetical protein
MYAPFMGKMVELSLCLTKCHAMSGQLHAFGCFTLGERALVPIG